MAPLLALLSILFGEAPAAAASPTRGPVAIVEIIQPETEAPGDAAPAGERWVGAVELPGQRLDFAVVLVETDGRLGGTLDIPMQGLSKGALRDVARDGSNLSFAFEIPGLPEVNWPHWTLTIDETGKAAGGVLLQSGGSFPTTMTLDEGGATELLHRPQNPTRPLPYRAIEVAIDAGGHTLAGTLTLPGPDEFGDGPFPGVVLITGSGPQDRDESLMGHKPFLVLSDRLTRRGIAVLRCDDRGFGASTGDFASATTLDFADDARACAAWLRGREEIGSVGLIGHSEGGLIAPIVAAGNEAVGFVVLLAAPGVPGHEILIRQSRELAAAGGVDGPTLDECERLMIDLYTAIGEGKPADVAKAILRELIAVQLAAAGQSLDDAALAQSTELHYAELTSPWMARFLTLDPRPPLREMTQPVLALNGSLDLQVLTDQNLAEIERVFEEAGKRGMLTSAELDGLNHLFQPATTGGIEEYATIETTFDESAMERIAEWILEHAE